MYMFSHINFILRCETLDISKLTSIKQSLTTLLHTSFSLILPSSFYQLPFKKCYWKDLSVVRNTVQFWHYEERGGLGEGTLRLAVTVMSRSPLDNSQLSLPICWLTNVTHSYLLWHTVTVMCSTHHITQGQNLCLKEKYVSPKWLKK